MASASIVFVSATTDVVAASAVARNVRGATSCHRQHRAAFTVTSTLARRSRRTSRAVLPAAAARTNGDGNDEFDEDDGVEVELAVATLSSSDVAPSDDVNVGARAGVVVGRRRAGLAAVTAAVGLATLVGGGSPAPAYASAAAKLDSVVELTPENFAAEVEGANAGRVFVEFYAPWCPFCQRLEPTWNELPSKLAAADVSTKIARMNVDTYTEYGQAYGVTGFPTLMLFQDGRPVGQKTGLVDMATAMKYAGVKDAGVLASLAGGPAPQMNLVLSGSQVDQALQELGALRRELDALPEGERAAAVERIRNVETLFAKRSL